MEERKRIFIENLNRLVSERGLNKKDLARFAEIPYITMMKWMSGEGYPRMKTLEKLANVLNVPVESLTTDWEKTENLLPEFAKLTKENQKIIRKLIQFMLEEQA